MSQESMQIELTLALEFREGFIKEVPVDQKTAALIEKELIHILYANNTELLETAQRNIDFLISPYLDTSNSAHQNLQKMLQALIDQRAGYLTNPPKTLFAYWLQHRRASLDLMLLTAPLLIGIAIPPVGIVALAYAAIDAGLAAIDFRHAHNEYWEEENPPGTRELDDAQIQTLQQTYKNIDDFLPEHNIDPQIVVEKQINTASYWTYGLMFVISLVALMALAFPPIGIPAIALSALLLVTLGGTGLQFAFTFQKQRAQLNNIQDALTRSDQLLDTHQHESTAVITERLATQETAAVRKNIELPPVNKKISAPYAPLISQPPDTSPKKSKKRKRENEGEGESGPQP